MPVGARSLPEGHRLANVTRPASLTFHVKCSEFVVISRRSIAVLLGVALLLMGVLALLYRPNSVVSTGSLEPNDVREIQRVVTRERWSRVARGLTKLEFRLARSHLVEVAKGRNWSVKSDGPPAAFVEVSEKSETGRRWTYQLERGTNGWKVIGVGYRSALIKNAPKGGAANGSQPMRSETNTTSSAAGRR